MSVSGKRRVIRADVRRSDRAAGFTLVEVIVSIALIGILMTALTTFFVSTVVTTDAQGSRQTAIRVADDAMEKVRSLKRDTLISGRGQGAVDSQWRTTTAAIGSHLGNMAPAYDDRTPPLPAATLTTSALTSRVNGVDYQQHWFVGRCWQVVGGGDCAIRDGVPFLKVVVAVTWPERNCPGDCTFVTATLISSAVDEPVFNPDAP